MNATPEKIAYLLSDDVEEWMERIERHFQPSNPIHVEQLQTAITLVRNSTITDYVFDDHFLIVSAKILDASEIYQVSLNFKDEHFTCSCFEAEWCAHKVALIFDLYLQMHSLSEWMTRWRKQATQQMQLKISKRTPEEWHTTIQLLLQPMKDIELSENPSIFIHKYTIMNQKATPLYPFEWEWRPLFDLFYRINLIDAMWPYVSYYLDNQVRTFSYGKWYVKNWLAEQLDAIEESILALGNKRRLFETDPFYDYLQVAIRNFMTTHNTLFKERFQIYRQFWQVVFTDKLTREREFSELQNTDSASTPQLLAYFSMMNGDEHVLTGLENEVNASNLQDWLPLAEVAEEVDDKDALASFMNMIVPYVGDYFNLHVTSLERPQFVRQIDGLLESAEFSEEVREGMFSLYGKAGVDVYADFLVERSRFREWAALMQRFNVAYETVESNGLKIALRDDPKAALPLMHLYALKFIEERNRQSYRRAVRVMKKMKIAAKKTGKMEFWNQYVEQVKIKYRRLRALTEEIEKGNLLL